MDCSKTKKQLIFRIEGALSSEQVREFDSHLETCTACAAMFSKLQQTLSATEKHRMDNPFFFQRVAHSISLAQAAPARRSAALVKALKPAVLSLVIIFSACIGVILAINYPDTRAAENEISPHIVNMAGDYHMNSGRFDAIENYYLSE